MFCTLSMEASKRRFARNIRITEKSVGSVTYLKMTVFKPVSGKKIEKRLNGRADKIIVSDAVGDISFPTLQVYKNEEFLKSVAMYSFKNILRLSKIPPGELAVAVTDRTGLCSDFVTSLVPSAAVIKVATDRACEYDRVSETLYENYGVSLIVTDRIEQADIGFEFSHPSPRVWFGTPENYAEITKNCVKIGAGLSSFVPKGISECDFAGALREYRDFRRLRLLSAEIMYKNGSYYKINEQNIKNFLDNSRNSC